MIVNVDVIVYQGWEWDVALLCSILLFLAILSQGWLYRVALPRQGPACKMSPFFCRPHCTCLSSRGARVM